MAGRKLIVEIIGDSRSLERAFHRSAKAGTRFDATVSGIGRSVAGVAAVFAGGAGLTMAIRSAFTEMNEANKVAAQTNAVLQSTGQVAGVTAGHVQELADQLLRKTGIDDEAIKSAENLLLTFTNLRNVTGKNNNVFDQATEAALNLSVALGTDLQSATLQIGKALQDPVRGITALRRAGVQLSAAQTAQIKSLVATGRVLEAQKIILRELETQVGGSAEAAGRTQPWNRLRETILNLGGDVAQSLLPAITRTVEKLQAWFDNTENTERLVRNLSGAVTGLAGALEKLARFGGQVKEETNKVKQFFLQAEVVSSKATLGFVRNFEKMTGVGGGMADQIEKDIRTLETKLGDAGKDAGEAWANGFATAGLRAKDIIEQRAAGGGMLPPTAHEIPPPPGGGGGLTAAERAAQRNRWFDANLQRQLSRLQDLGLKKQLARLRQLAAEVRARLAVVKDVTYRLKLEDDLLGILRQQRSVQADIVDNIKAANDALKDRADAIKSAVLDRLQARQTDILNKRALADAKEQLRIARQIGGPQGIKGAMRGLQDVQFDMMRARLEAAPATLTPTGRFQLGNVVTINVHGVTDPAAVARQVTEIMKKRSRRTTTQIRPTAAGQTA